jgi:O-antigen ligase
MDHLIAMTSCSYIINNAFIKSNSKLLLHLLLLIAIFPVFSLDKTDPFGFEPLSTFATSKLIRLAWLVIIVMLNSSIFINATFLGLYKHCKLRYYDVLLLLYALTAFMSIAYKTPAKLVAWYRAIELFFVIISIIHCMKLFNPVFVNDCFRQAFIRSIYKLLFVIIVLMSAIYLFSPDLIFISEIQDRNRLGGYVYSPNFLAAILSIIQIANFYVNGKLNRFTLFWIHSFIISIMVILTGSRTGLITLLLVDFVLFYIYVAIKSKHNTLLMQKTVLWILFGLGTFFSILIYVAGDQLLLLASSLLGIGSDPLTELLTLNNRVSIYITAIQGITENPFLGVGYVEGVRSFLLNNYQLVFWLPPHVHNGILEIILAQGLIGGLPFLIFIALTACKSAKYLFKPYLYKKDLLVLSTIVLIVLIGSITTVAFGNVVNSIEAIFLLASLIILDYENGNSSITLKAPMEGLISIKRENRK